MNDDHPLHDCERIVLAMSGARTLPGAKVTHGQGVTSIATDTGWFISFLTDGPRVKLNG